MFNLVDACGRRNQGPVALPTRGGELEKATTYSATHTCDGTKSPPPYAHRCQSVALARKESDGVSLSNRQSGIPAVHYACRSERHSEWLCFVPGKAANLDAL